MAPTDRRASTLSLAVLLFVVGLLFLTMVSPFVLALSMGALAATLTHPIYRRLERLLGPLTSAALVVAGLTVLAVGPLSVFAAIALKEGRELFSQLTKDGAGVSPSALAASAARRFPLLRTIGGPEDIERGVSGFLMASVSQLSEEVLARFSGVPEAALQGLLALISCFFFLMEGERLLDWAFARIPLAAEPRRSVLDALRDGVRSSILAAFAAALAQTLLLLLGFVALGIPGIFFAVGVSFVLSWLPIIGCSPVWIGASVYLFAQGATGRAIAMLCIGLATSVVDNIVRPLVLKGRGDIHPLLGFVAILGAIRLFGVAGVFLGPVVATLLIALLDAIPPPRTESDDSTRRGRGEASRAEALEPP
ncbi:MAG: AI-2E family transporter [Elusimicrobia bacterium]|nr:AI-2E family transporter [Elusimicrobiota bacterium]